MVHFGRPLVGVSAPPQRVRPSWQTLLDGNLQKYISRQITDSIPFRPFLVRLNNEVRYELFGKAFSPRLTVGAGGQLVEAFYLDEYCQRGPDTALKNAGNLIPLLLPIQQYYRGRNSIFVFVISPSKVAYLPEAFASHCPDSRPDGTNFLPEMTRLLRDAGISVVDSASLIQSLKHHSDVSMFPRGGAHWNMLGAAHAADAIISEINRQANRPLAPKLSFTYEVTNRPRGTDRDLADLLNLLFPRIRYPVPAVVIRPSVPCDEKEVTSLNVALIGNSFAEHLYNALYTGGCFINQQYYKYLARREFGYPLQSVPIESEDFTRIRDADIVILEQNEIGLSQGSYIAKLANELVGK